MGNIRIGIVQSIKTEDRTVRVYFEDTKVMSGDLKVLRYNSPNEASWVPSINEKVLCLYRDTFNGDGFVIGGI